MTQSGISKILDAKMGSESIQNRALEHKVAGFFLKWILDRKQMERGYWKLVAGTGRWGPGSGKWSPKVRNRRKGDSPVTVRPSIRPASPGTPGETLFKYIRSGPEGARGVLEV